MSQKQEMASQPKLEMSQEKIEAIDSKLSVAPDGSKFINPEVKANLTETETTEINKALTNFNKLSEATKDGRDSAMQVLEQEIVEAKQVAFGEISASANGCNKKANRKTVVSKHWWGWRSLMNVCAAKEAAKGFMISGFAYAMAATGLAAFGQTHVAAIIGIVAAYHGLISGLLYHYADECSRGAYLNVNDWLRITEVKSRCK